MKNPRLDIYLNKITENARLLREKCGERNIQITGVVKGAAGDLEVVKAFIRGGIISLGDSRLENLINFSQANLKTQRVLLRLPRLTEISKVVRYTDISLVSEIATIRALSREAVRHKTRQKIIIMVDVGDLREGVLPADLDDFLGQIIDLPGVNIYGLGTNVGCYGGVLPSYENTNILLELKRNLENKYPVNLNLISGGNTATTILFNEDRLPVGINNLRIGEAILLGTDITNQRIIPYLNQNNFILTTTVIEIKNKPSVPNGEIGYNGFGESPDYIDKGIRKRAILAIGRQDTGIDGLTPREEGAMILGASSDHLIVDVSQVEGEIRVGGEMSFKVDYGAMLRAMTSPYVHRVYHD